MYKVAHSDEFCDTDHKEYAMNITGTGDRDHPLHVPGRSILSTLRRNTLEETDIDLCSRLGCKNEAQVGGHVWLKGDNRPWATPLCKCCNNYSNTKWFLLKEFSVVAPLIPV